MSVLYLILFILSVLYLFLLLVRFRQKVSLHYILLSVCIILITYSYWQISIATTLEEALSASRICYLGAGFVAYCTVCSIARICKTRVPVAVQCAGVGLGVAVTALSMTIGHSSVYYKSVQLIRLDGYSYLIKEYGPAHAVFIAEILLWLCYGLWIVGRSFQKRKKVSYISSIGSLAVMVSVSLVYFIRSGIYPLLPLAYDIGFAIILLLLTRISLHDTVGIFEESVKGGQDYGFANFDTKGHFLDGDDMARKWFPELNELRVDRRIPEYSTEFLRQIQNWMTDRDEANSHWFTCGEQIVEARRNTFRPRAHKRILCIYLRDDTQQQRYTRLIEHYNLDLQRDVALKTQKIGQIQNDIIISMASIVENRDANTGGHIRRSSEVVGVFVRHLLQSGDIPGLTGHVADCIIRSAPLHDFGKIAISDAILNKPGKYTPEEYNEMKKHPVLGTGIVARILQSSEDVVLKNIAVNMAHYHHEKWDGTGYPDGKAGTDIPLEARVMALADVFDALVSKRAYKEPFGFERSFSIIRESSGSHFDPVLCERFLECRERLMEIYPEQEAGVRP